MRLSFTLILISFWCFAQKRNVKVTDLTKIRQISQVEVSPDKNWALVTIKSIQNAEADEYEYKTQIFVKELKDKTTHLQQLTFSADGASNAHWTGDSRSIIFNRTVAGVSQIFQMNISGGEAKQVTFDKKGANLSHVQGQKVLFTQSFSLKEVFEDSLLNPSKSMPNWSLEKPGLTNEQAAKVFDTKKIKANPDGNIDEIRAYLHKDVTDKVAKVVNRLNFQGEATVEPDMYFQHLYVLNLEDSEKPKLMTNGFVSYGQPRFSTTSTAIWAVRDANTTEHPDREQNTSLIEIDIATGNQKVLFQKPGYQIQDFEKSSTGTWAMNLSVTGKLSFSELFLIDASGKETPVVFDRSVNQMIWDEAGTQLFFTASSNGGVPIFRYSIKDAKVQRLSGFETGIQNFDLLKDQLIFAINSIETPHELAVSSIEKFSPQIISAINANWVKDLNLSKPEKFSFKNEQGMEVDYWIMPPTQLEKGKKYPLLLNMHGGPTAMWGPGEASMWHEFQYFCSQGYGIVYANPRGSGGYGQAFQFANYRDWGTGPASDVLRACTEAQKLSWVDTSKLVLTGGSYAGYLTAWIVGHDHRFKAAFAQRGVYDLKTFMGEGNAWRLTPNYFGLPWQPESETQIEANSPINYVNNIKTPLLIKHGENDLRTGLIQSEMLYKSMKYLNKEVEYVRMPKATHELSRTGNVRQRIDRMLRIHEFFYRYVGH